MQTTREPFFLMVNLTNTHYPWAPPPGLLLSEVGIKNLRHLANDNLVNIKPFQYNSGRRKITDTQKRMWLSLYDASIMHVDREVGRFIKNLQKWQGWNNTNIVITADHGEMLGEYRDIVGHTLCLHDNILHVPMIMRTPSNASGRVVERVVQTLDLYPTILEWAGVKTSGIPAAQLRRPSLLRSLAEPGKLDGFAFAEEDYTDSYDVLGGLKRVNPKMDENLYSKRQVAIRSATHKFIFYDDRPGEFYNLEEDPNEEVNQFDRVIGEDKKILLNMQTTLDSWVNDLEVFPPRHIGRNGEIDVEVYDRLRELGYLE
jgi:arylsulfatase A-like enzyme